MRINKALFSLPAIILGGSLLHVSGASAFDITKKFKPDEEPRTILRYGYQALKRGAVDEAISAFRLGAERNDLASQWKLARMLQTGDGVPVDHFGAYELYRKIVERFDLSPPRSDEQAYVANAMVALGHYELRGIEGTEVKANAVMAERYFYRAAAIFQDAEAQYQLGQLYRFGALGAKQKRLALRWIGLSHQKGHLGARAAIGEMLFYGEGLRRDPVRGLVLMGQAAIAADPKSQAWMHDSYLRALEKAEIAQRKAAKDILNQMAANTVQPPEGPAAASQAKASE